MANLTRRLRLPPDALVAAAVCLSVIGILLALPSEAPAMHGKRKAQGLRLVITTGFQAGDGSYEEEARFQVTVPNSRTSVSALLHQVRRACPDREFIRSYGDWIYLEIPGTGTELDPTKTVGDYGLRAGSTLRLFTSVR